MYRLCKTEQSAMRQKQLEKGLLQAMRTERYEDISISELCDRMQIPRKSFYRYFSSKDGALMALLDHTLMEFEQSSQTNSSHKSSAIGDLERYFVFWRERSELLDALEKSRLSGMLVERATAHAMNERMMPTYLRSKPEDIQSMVLTFAVCGLLSMVIQWHHEGYKQSPQDMAKVATWMLTRPLIPG